MFNNLFRQQQTPSVERSVFGEPTSNVFGATGLSRASLRSLLKNDGLFGEDTGLTPAEKAVVARAVGQAWSAPALPVEWFSRKEQQRLATLERFVAAAVRRGGKVERYEWEGAKLEGYSLETLSEALRVVRLVRDVFGLPTVGLTADVKVATVTQQPQTAALAKAA